MKEMEKEVRQAVRHFWKTRSQQAKKQGAKSGTRDQGARTAVTGGKQMDGFADLVRDLLVRSGIPEVSIFCRKRLELPGYFRPEKQWDLLAVVDGHLIATVELKSHVGPSFGNNYNNRTEEALGSATDLWTAYREGIFSPSQRPWLGYLVLLEECPASLSPVALKETHFRACEEFRGASYAGRYEILLTKLVRERLYDSACFLLSNRKDGMKGIFQEPSQELSFENFCSSLMSRAIAFAKTHS